MAFRHLLPVGISLALGVAIFMYWSASSQLQEIRQSNRALKRELTSSRSERDNVQYRLNLVKSDLEQAVRNKEESERRAQELDEQLQEERGKLVSGRGSGRCPCRSVCDSRQASPGKA